MPGKVQQLWAGPLPHTKEMGEQISTSVYELQNHQLTLPQPSKHKDNTALAVTAVLPKACAKMSLVAHLNQKHTGKGILETQPSLVKSTSYKATMCL